MSSVTTRQLKNLEADMVIIGGGGGGLAAAITAAEAGIRNVLVLEKQGEPGGNTARANNFFGIESPAQKRAGINIRPEEFFKAYMNWHHWKPNPRIIRAFIDKSGDTMRWLEDKGLHFDCVPLYADQTMLVYHLTEGAGAAVMRALIEECRKLGIQVLTNTPAKKLLVGKDGSINGVLAETDGEEFSITTKSVIIAAGGYNGNKELIRKYFPGFRAGDRIVSDAILNNGDGLLMAMEIGAATIGLERRPRGGGALPGTAPTVKMKLGNADNTFEVPLICVTSDSSTIWVNDKGLRFCDEDYFSTHHPACLGLTSQQTFKASYAIFDQGIVRSFTEKGLSIGYMHVAPRGTPLPGFERELKVKADEGWVQIFNSLDDVAEWIGADPKVLKETVREYNTACEQGYDPIFAKNKKYLVPLRTPPYYVLGRRPVKPKDERIFMVPLDTTGGIKINERMEVLNKKDNPIPGLYAVGVTTGGWEANWDDSMNSGSAASFAINSGRIAAENAAGYISGLKSV